MSQEQHDEALKRMRMGDPLTVDEIGTLLRWSHRRRDDDKKKPASIVECLIIRLLHHGYVLRDGYTVPSPVSPKRATAAIAPEDEASIS